MAPPLFLPAAPRHPPVPEFATGHRLILGVVGRLRPPTFMQTGPTMTALPKFLVMTMNILNNIKIHTLLIIHKYMATYLLTRTFPVTLPRVLRRRPLP